MTHKFSKWPIDFYKKGPFDPLDFGQEWTLDLWRSGVWCSCGTGRRARQTDLPPDRELGWQACLSPRPGQFYVCIEILFYLIIFLLFLPQFTYHSDYATSVMLSRDIVDVGEDDHLSEVRLLDQELIVNFPRGRMPMKISPLGFNLREEECPAIYWKWHNTIKNQIFYPFCCLLCS